MYLIFIDNFIVLLANYSGTLSASSPTFTRPDGDVDGRYYYQAIKTTVDTSGTYTIRTNSFMKIYGCLYTSSFDSSNPSENQITCAQDTENYGPFFISNYMQPQYTYILVITTVDDDYVGSYSVTATGPGSVTMTSYSSASE